MDYCADNAADVSITGTIKRQSHPYRSAEPESLGTSKGVRCLYAS